MSIFFVEKMWEALSAKASLIFQQKISVDLVVKW